MMGSITLSIIARARAWLPFADISQRASMAISPTQKAVSTGSMHSKVSIMGSTNSSQKSEPLFSGAQLTIKCADSVGPTLADAALSSLRAHSVAHLKASKLGGVASVRRDCLDPVIEINGRQLRRVVRSYVDYYHEDRTHLGLEKDTPQERSVEPREMGEVVAIPRVGGLHHRYSRELRSAA